MTRKENAYGQVYFNRPFASSSAASQHREVPPRPIRRRLPLPVCVRSGLESSISFAALAPQRYSLVWRPHASNWADSPVTTSEQSPAFIRHHDNAPNLLRMVCAAEHVFTSGLLAIFLRAVETTLRQRSPDAPPDARFGAVAFVHRFGSYLNSHIHYHVLVTDGVFSTGSDGEAVFHPALDLDASDFIAVQQKMRHRGLRWLHRHGHLDGAAIHTMDTPEHAGGWSVDASIHLPAWDRQGLERLVRYCARPPLSQERLGRLNAESLVYSLRKPTLDGRTELILSGQAS
ncbi:MAG TPA: transposase [Candidatus Tectomicrobia bacterium]